MSSGSSSLLYNGQLLPATGFALPLPNRGLFFNDGFFETLVWAETGLRYLEHHLNRLQRAAEVLALELPVALATPTALTQTLGQLAAANAQSLARIRLQIWRQGAGLYAPTTMGCEWLATCQPFSALDTSVDRADFAHNVQTHFSAVSFCKGPNALTYVRAAQERAQRQLDELLLLSTQGYVAEAVSSSVAWIREDTIYTPGTEAGGVLSVRLAHLQVVAQRLGLRWQSGLYPTAHLLAAEAVFTANVAGVRAVQEVAGIRFASANHSVLQQLRAAETV